MERWFRTPAPAPAPRRRMLRSLAVFAPLAGSAAVLAWPAGPARAQQAPPASGAASRAPRDVVADLVGAMASGNAGVIRSLFAREARQTGATDKPLAGDAFFRWLDSEIIGRQARIDNPLFIPNGDEVVVRGQFRGRGYATAAHFQFKVDKGRIVGWQFRS